MRVEKLLPKDYKDPVAFLHRIKLTRNNQGFPERVHVCHEDYDKFTQAVTEAIKKDSRVKNKKYLEAQVGYMMLQYGPSQRLARIVQPGYCLIEDLIEDLPNE